MDFVGSFIENISLQVCTAFKPKIRDKKLCYQIDISTFQEQITESNVGTYKLALILDYNEDRMVRKRNSGIQSLHNPSDIGDIFEKSTNVFDAEVWIETLGLDIFA